MSKEREPEHSASSSERTDKTGRDDAQKGPGFDLRGFLVNKQMIRQIRHSVEQKQRSAEKGGDGCIDEAKHEGRWAVEPQHRGDMYAFDPNDPMANPDWGSDLQVVLS